jgi:hypothetical protein
VIFSVSGRSGILFLYGNARIRSSNIRKKIAATETNSILLFFFKDQGI